MKTYQDLGRITHEPSEAVACVAPSHVSINFSVEGVEVKLEEPNKFSIDYEPIYSIAVEVDIEP